MRGCVSVSNKLSSEALEWGSCMEWEILGGGPVIVCCVCGNLKGQRNKRESFQREGCVHTHLKDIITVALCESIH